MDVLYRQFLIGIATIVLSTAVFADKITPDGAVELMGECQAQREESIAPLREQAITDCVANKGRDQAYCESYNRTFGNARPRAGGGMIPGMFWDLPVCEKAVAAERYFRMNPGSRSYNLP
ncbi:MAG: hypothetical protein V7746_11860 [Halioglobus sp.]